MTGAEYDADYIVIGSGAGGGPLAANLALRGFKVLLLEAGDDICQTTEGRLLYEVPAFHGLCTEYDQARWDFYVHHYTDPDREKLDSKYCKKNEGVLYPRTGALGGCTVHNAMVTITPQAIDWDFIARSTGDWSWRTENMYKYWERLERCMYRPRPWTLGYVVQGLFWSIAGLWQRRKDWKKWKSGHGFDGWLPTDRADPRLVLNDRSILKILKATLCIVVRAKIGSVLGHLCAQLDPNDIRNSDNARRGLALTPMTTFRGKRHGPREFILETARAKPQNLKVELNTLATKVIFNGKQAVGVEARQGAFLYKASPLSTASRPYEKRCFRAAREVIVAGGAFNSPQLLMLSGIGAAEELKALGIEVVVDLPGVGKNLQDRYEVSVVSELPEPFLMLKGATFAPPTPQAPPDPVFELWRQGKGLYCSTGSVIVVMERSSPDLPEPDLFIFGFPGFFAGYKRGYSALFEKTERQFSWIILKAYTNNTAGSVTLVSADPTQRPRVDCKYFQEGNDTLQQDLYAVLKGVKLVREMNNNLGGQFAKEQIPGPGYESDEATLRFIQNEAWGHHASCTNKIGPRSDRMAVLDSRFRVHGTQGLRVVDASVFPKIPGYFIVAAIYMISEKACDVIVEDAAAADPRLGPNELGAEAMRGEDRTFGGSRFAEVAAALFENSYQRVWGADSEPPLPVYRVTLANLMRGILSCGPSMFRRATERAIDSKADLRWGPDKKGFRRLLHPNGVCLTGTWQITEETDYSGYFRIGSEALMVGRLSTCCSETRRGHVRSLAFAGKLFPTNDPKHAEPLLTANVITQEDIGGDYTDFINDVELRNAPNTTVWRRGAGTPSLLLAGLVFGIVDKQPTIRQLYQIAELGKPAGQPTRAPRFLRLRVAADQPRIEGRSLDLRDEIMAQIYDRGDPRPKRQLVFCIEVTDDGRESGPPFWQRRSLENWRRIGKITFDKAVVSYNGDFVLHFNHPTWREDENDPLTAIRIDERKVTGRA